MRDAREKRPENGTPPTIALETREMNVLRLPPSVFSLSRCPCHTVKSLLPPLPGVITERKECNIVMSRLSASNSLQAQVRASVGPNNFQVARNDQELTLCC